jgi:hypothetical protein
MQNSVARPAHRETETTLKGCLEGGRGRFYLASLPEGRLYRLAGQTSQLAKYVDKEIGVQGTEHQPLFPFRWFVVARLTGVYNTPRPRLSLSFRSSSTWYTERSQKWGIKFDYPRDFSKVPVPGATQLQANFVNNQNIVTIGRFAIPGEIYPGTDLVGGSMAVYIAPEIGNSPGCRQFGFFDPKYASSHAVGTVQYAVVVGGEGAAGTRFSDHYFHTFQNGLCYEIAVELAEISTGNLDLGCTVPALRRSDELNLIEPLITQVHFFGPAVVRKPKSNPQPLPQVTWFAASSRTADDANNRGQIIFSWSTQNTDYVELSYRCLPTPAGPGAIILVDGGPSNCENESRPLEPNLVRNYAPNASQSVLFGNFHRLDPISVIATVTPFSYGRADPESSRSISIRVDPYHPFPEGVPAANRKVILTYSVREVGGSKLPRGSSLTIRWKDMSPRDPCVDLYLVQDDGKGGESYRSPLGGKCLTPPKVGSYTWTVPARYSGAGYRIFASTPGGASTGLGPAFSIVRNPASGEQ